MPRSMTVCPFASTSCSSSGAPEVASLERFLDILTSRAYAGLERRTPVLSSTARDFDRTGDRRPGNLAAHATPGADLKGA